MNKSAFSFRVSHMAAAIVTHILGIILFVCANSNSCCMVYQPKVPEGLEKYSQIL